MTQKVQFVTFFLLAAHLVGPRGWAQPLTYNFLEGQGRGLVLDAKASTPLSRVTVEGREGMSAQPAAGQPAEIVLRLSTPDGPSNPITLGAVLEYYDQASPEGLKVGGDTLTLTYPDASANQWNSAAVWLACREKAAEPYRQATWRRRAVILKEALLGADEERTALKIKASGTCILRSVSLRPLSPEALAAGQTLQEWITENFFRQTRIVIDRVRAEELVRQLARADCYTRQAGRKGWPEELNFLRQQQAGWEPLWAWTSIG